MSKTPAFYCLSFSISQLFKSLFIVIFFYKNNLNRLAQLPSALFNEHLAERHIFDVLQYLAIEVDDVATAQMFEVVVELHLLVVILRLVSCSFRKKLRYIGFAFNAVITYNR